MEYVKLVSLLKYRHCLPKTAAVKLELRLADCIQRIREKVVTGCAKKVDG